MPKLLVFAPCEKVIISQDENNPTLISVLTELSGEFEVQAKTEMPAEAMLPFRWTVFVMWRAEEGDADKEFDQTIRFTSPTGKTLIDNTASFRLEKQTHRMISHIPAVPVGQLGWWTLSLYMRPKGQAIPSEPLAVYPLNIHFIQKTSTSTVTVTKT